MGNRGMTNWKLSAFFVMSLMLIAAVFSNTVMAAKDDGAGTVTVATLATPPSGIGSDETDGTITKVAVVAVGDEAAALPAGSKFNALQFTYQAYNDNNPTSDAVITGTDTPDTAINMAGGKVRIAFPAGWTVSNKFVQVTDGGTDVIYETDGEGDGDLNTDIFPVDSDEETAANAAVTLSAANITINLGTEWGGGREDVDVGRELVIIFSDVTAGLTAGAAKFTSSSSARGGNLVLLKAGSPEVPVGNILGVNITEAVTTMHTR